jgi:hypothetical protein
LKQRSIQDILGTDPLLLVISRCGLFNWPAMARVSKTFNRLTKKAIDQWFNQLNIPQTIVDSIVNVESMKMRLYCFASRREVYDRERWKKNLLRIQKESAKIMFDYAYYFFPFKPDVEIQFTQYINQSKKSFPQRNALLLNQAAYHGNSELVRFLHDTLKIPFKNDFAWHLCQSANFLAVKELYQDLIRECPEFKFEHSHLHLALTKGNEEVVEFILEKQPELRSELRLDQAASSGNLSLVKTLVKKNVPIDEYSLVNALFTENPHLVNYLRKHQARFFESYYQEQVTTLGTRAGNFESAYHCATVQPIPVK